MSAIRPIPATTRATVADAPSAAVPVVGRAAAKGAQTKQAIVDTALQLASRSGLEGLSIGVLADAMGMSKSGVFAHFGSREELQISVIRAYHQRFEAEVFMPALKAARGLPRLHQLYANWVKRVSLEIDQGCIYISGAVEFDDRPGPVRDALFEMVRTWHNAMLTAVEQAKLQGHLRASVDTHQLLFEIHGMVLSLHHDARFMRTPGSVDRAMAGFDRLVQQYRTTSQTKQEDNTATAAKPAAAKKAKLTKNVQKSSR